ncbi:MAG: CHAT domain-containing protein [Bacteroidetes bacterium]|nr:MAG: CHAT domain-containing protein [Bacteroidota bacterium]
MKNLILIYFYLIIITINAQNQNNDLNTLLLKNKQIESSSKNDYRAYMSNLEGIIKKYFELGYYDSSRIFAQKWSETENIISKPQSQSRYFANLRHGESLYKCGDFKKADSLFLVSTQFFSNKLSKESLAQLFYTRALINYKKGNFDTTQYCLEQYKADFISKPLFADIRVKNIQSLMLLSKGQYDEATEIQKNIYENLIKSINDSALIANHLMVYSKCLIANASYKKAFIYASKAKNIMTNKVGNGNINLCPFIDQLAAVYYEKSDFGKALELAEYSLFTKQKFLNEDNPEIADSYALLADINLGLEKNDLYASYHNKAYAIYKSKLDSTHLALALSSNNVGIVEQKNDYFESSISYLKKSESIYNQSFTDKNNYLLAKVYNDLGGLNTNQKQTNKAIENYNKAINIYNNIFNKKHPIIAETYNNLASEYQNVNQYEKALMSYQKAIIANKNDFNDTINLLDKITINGIADDFVLLQTLSEKSAVLEKIWDQKNAKYDSTKQFKESEISELLAANQNYKTCEILIKRLRESFTNEDSKIILSKKTSKLTEKSSNLCLRIGKLTANKKYIEEAILASEKSKAAALLSAIQATNAKHIAGVPDSILKTESDIAKSLKDNQIKLIKEMKKGKKADAELVAELQNKVATLSEQKLEIIQNIERNYPKYYDLKYNTKPVSISTIQKTILSKDSLKLDHKSTMVQYLVGDSYIFVTIINPENYEMIKLKKDSLLLKYINYFRNGIRFNLYDLHYEASFKLYQSLVKPILKFIKTKNLIIVPDGVMALLPFEALIMDKNIEKVQNQVSKSNFHKLHYLNKKYNIKYCFSSQLAMELSKPILEKRQTDFIGISPVFMPKHATGIKLNSIQKPTDMTLDMDFKTSDFDSTKAFSPNLSPIEAAYNEVSNLQKMYDKKSKVASSFLNQFGQESIMKNNNIKYSKVLHIATHGMVDASNPELSGLYFANDPTQKEDGILYAGEIYNTQINADLVVLSACQTGLGKITKGEGLLGLSRSLIFSGAKNLVVSLWSVNDLTTNKIMSKFYKCFVSKNNTIYYSKYLRKSKLKMSRKKATAFPYYWAPFIHIGG